MKFKNKVYMRTAPQEDDQNPPSADINPLPVDQRRTTTELWLPEASTAFKLLMSANMASALLSNISDCDETYNYWEPLHYIFYGDGFQTWEYSPAYAIRSWAYIRMHSVLTWPLFNMLNSNKLFVFYFIRTMLAFFCSVCEVQFYKGIALIFGNNVARMLLVFLTFGAGMFISATAFLPSTFCMYMTCLVFGFWMQGYLQLAVLSVAAGAILGWPFSAAIGIPLAIDILLRRQNYSQFFKWCCIALLTMLLPSMLIDTYYYGKPVIASLNIVLYNVFSEHGPDLYGTEPLSFYIINGVLNFNVAFLLALFSGPIVAISELIISVRVTGYRMPYVLFLLFLSPFYVWIAIFFTQPHKEERFLFPVYPLICFGAAVAIATVQKLYCIVLKWHKIVDFRWISISTLAIYVILSISRVFALFQGYHAPLEIYPSLIKVSEDLGSVTSEHNLRVCVGKEWYRYPSSFFLPTNFTMHFVKSEFRGQLPGKFEGQPPEGSRRIPADMNDANIEELTRYADVKSCDFMVDVSISGHASKYEPNYATDKTHWDIVKSIDFLDSARSENRLLRAFYIPYVFETRNRFSKYVLLQSKSSKILGNG